METCRLDPWLNSVQCSKVLITGWLVPGDGRGDGVTTEGSHHRTVRPRPVPDGEGGSAAVGAGVRDIKEGEGEGDAITGSRPRHLPVTTPLARPRLHSNVEQGRVECNALHAGIPGSGARRNPR